MSALFSWFISYHLSLPFKGFSFQKFLVNLSIQVLGFLLFVKQCFTIFWIWLYFRNLCMLKLLTLISAQSNRFFYNVNCIAAEKLTSFVPRKRFSFLICASKMCSIFTVCSGSSNTWATSSIRYSISGIRLLEADFLISSRSSVWSRFLSDLISFLRFSLKFFRLSAFLFLNPVRYSLRKIP